MRTKAFLKTRTDTRNFAFTSGRQVSAGLRRGGHAWPKVSDEAASIPVLHGKADLRPVAEQLLQVFGAARLSWSSGF